ncbi:hypothetical protein OG233_10510 [Streptomyces sp. NBC_01218]|uniref:hypothetical protein n=1 Tax=Streptomyces sp. NBC_01218 TaxID=2903780 RepID=UPI002E139F4C|nr:hypothetical protein OG233_10510 [Streptomyces sp. NBC_01218]
MGQTRERRRAGPPRAAGLLTVVAVALPLLLAPAADAAPAATPEYSASSAFAASVLRAVSTDPGRDVLLVYCLDPAHRAELVAAGTRLGVLDRRSPGPGRVLPAGADRPVTVEEWAGGPRSDDFARACSALMAAAAGTPGGAGEKKEKGWPAELLTSLPLLVAGALLTLAGQASERVNAERRANRQQLALGELTYRTAVGTYLAAYESEGYGDHTAVLAARETLTAPLARISGPAARRAEARRLTEGLPLARPLAAEDGGGFLGRQARLREAHGVRLRLDRELGALAGLDRRAVHWRWRTVRERFARRTPGGGA